MKQTPTGADFPAALPRRLRADDARVPADVRAQLAGFTPKVASLAPVRGIGRTEWMLFDAAGVPMGSLFDGIHNRGAH